MKPGWITICALFLTASVALAQNVRSPIAAKPKQLHLAPCSELGNPKSCKTFNAMVAGHDLELAILAKLKSYVCFGTKADDFFTLSYAPFSDRDVSYYNVDPDSLSEFDKADYIFLKKYWHGQTDLSYLINVVWDWDKGVPGSSYATLHPKHDNEESIKDVQISESRLYVAFTYIDKGGEEATETIIIRISTKRYNTEFQTVKYGLLEGEEGQCVVYPRR